MMYRVWVNGEMKIETYSKREANQEADHWRRQGFLPEVSWVHVIGA